MEDNYKRKLNLLHPTYLSRGLSSQDWEPTPAQAMPPEGVSQFYIYNLWTETFLNSPKISTLNYKDYSTDSTNKRDYLKGHY